VGEASPIGGPHALGRLGLALPLSASELDANIVASVISGQQSLDEWGPRTGIESMTLTDTGRKCTPVMDFNAQ
jgi:hypothetical protein